jgi:hypothetical protein
MHLCLIRHWQFQLQSEGEAIGIAHQKKVFHYVGTHGFGKIVRMHLWWRIDRGRRSYCGGCSFGAGPGL